MCLATETMDFGLTTEMPPIAVYEWQPFMHVYLQPLGNSRLPSVPIYPARYLARTSVRALPAKLGIDFNETTADENLP